MASSLFCRPWALFTTTTKSLLLCPLILPRLYNKKLHNEHFGKVERDNIFVKEENKIIELTEKHNIPQEEGSDKEAQPIKVKTSFSLDSLLNFTDRDVREQFVRGQGPGGQATNKTNNCVVLTHLATHTTIRCHASRSQFRNRATARIMLRERLRQKFGTEEEKITPKIAKIRNRKRQKMKNSIRKQSLMDLILSPDKDNNDGVDT